MYTAHGCSFSVVFCSLILSLQFFISQSLAQSTVCTTIPICSPAAGDEWQEDTVGTIYWNPSMTAPFGETDFVDIYIVDDNDTTTLKFQMDVDLSIGVAGSRLDATLYPETLPANRSCHILMVKNGDDPSSSQNKLISSSFFMIRTMETINGTQVPIPSSSATSISSSTTVLSTTTISTTSQTTTSSASIATSSSTSGDIVSTSPTTVPESASKTSTISPLVIGLISAGSVALIIAVIAIALLLRTRRRFKDDSGDFTSLRDNPSSPTDETSKSSIFKSEESQDVLSKGAAVGVPFGAMAAARSSSNTVRSAEPMIKEAPNVLAYNSTQSPPSPTASLPLVERGASILGRTPESSEGVGSGAEATEGFGSEKSSRGAKGSALSAGDAQLIADTFRKSMRRPCWDDTDDQDEEEQDEARRAAKELLKRELSEQGLDVQRGVQRRVTIQDSTHRSSAHPPLSHKTDDSRS